MNILMSSLCFPVLSSLLLPGLNLTLSQTSALCEYLHSGPERPVRLERKQLGEAGLWPLFPSTWLGVSWPSFLGPGCSCLWIITDENVRENNWFACFLQTDRESSTGHDGSLIPSQHERQVAPQANPVRATPNNSQVPEPCLDSWVLREVSGLWEIALQLAPGSGAAGGSQKASGHSPPSHPARLRYQT